MKVILTEEQLRQVIQEEVIEENLITSLLGLGDPGKIIKKIVIALLLGTITFAAVPKIIGRLGQSNPAVEQVGEENFIDKIKNMFTKLKDKEQQVTDKMDGYTRRVAAKANEISNEALSKICWWETRHNFGYPMSEKDLKGYYVKGEARKTYGYGLRTHPNGQFMEDVKSAYTQKELEELFKQKIKNETDWVLKWANNNGVTLNQGQLDAMVSAVYNYGHSGFLRTGIPALIAQNPNNPEIAEKWAHLADTRAKKYPGLVKRRTEEANWYRAGQMDVQPRRA